MKKKIASENLTKALLQLNLTEKEIMSYLVLLQKGALSIQDISHSTGINRVTTYAAIEELKQKGLVAESRKGKRKLFVAEDPESLENIIIEKRERLKREHESLENVILPMLKAMNIRQENKPEIKFFEGIDGISKLYDEYMPRFGEVINCGSFDKALEVYSEKDESEWLSLMEKKKIFLRMILEDTPLNRKFAKMAGGKSYAKFMPVESKIPSDIAILGTSKTALISYDKMTVTLIEDESIAQSFKAYLDFIWERL